MKHPFLVHMLVALVWLFLSGTTTLGNFFLAIALTFLLLALFQKPLHCRDYVRRVCAFCVFVARLIFAIIGSNLRIMRVVMWRNASAIEGAFTTYDVSDLTDFEVLLLSVCVGLSPGTIVADRSEDGKELVLHVFAVGSSAEIRATIDVTLKSGILSFTR